MREHVREKLVKYVVIGSSVMGGAGTAGIAARQHQAMAAEAERVLVLEEREREAHGRLVAIETNVAWLVRQQGGTPATSSETRPAGMRTATR
jgi:hypothetical protein